MIICKTDKVMLSEIPQNISPIRVTPPWVVGPCLQFSEIALFQYGGRRGFQILNKFVDISYISTTDLAISPLEVTFVILLCFLYHRTIYT